MSAKSSVKAVDYPSPDTLLQLDPHVVDALDFTGFPETYGFAKIGPDLPQGYQVWEGGPAAALPHGRSKD